MKREKKKNKSNSIIIFFQIIFLIMFVISIYKIVEWKINNQKNDEILLELKESIKVENLEDKEVVQQVYNTNISENKEEIESIYDMSFKKLKEKNSNTVAWLKVNGTNIDYPVVQTDNNEFYLKHNFYKQYNTAGWIFADYRNKLDGADKNIIIYGHNVRNNSMFGSLKKVLNENWYNNSENYLIDFSTETENIKYQVFSVYQIETEEYYISTSFSNDAFKKYIETVKARSIKDFNVDLTEDDNILTLSTCANNNKFRVVLHAKKI